MVSTVTRRGRLVLSCRSNETLWIDGNAVLISDKLIDEMEGRVFMRFGASIRIYRDGYQHGQRLQRLVIEAPRNIQIQRDSVRRAMGVNQGRAA
jgi:sRNA-binding carbon storage regulator CsrA